MKQFKTIKKFVNTHIKPEQARENVFKILIKNQLSSKQILIIKDCNISSVKTLREMLKNVKQKKINRVIEFIFLIIDQQVLHSNCEINIELLFTTIDAIVITNHTFEIKKIKITKKTFNAKEYVIDHLRLR